MGKLAKRIPLFIGLINFSLNFAIHKEVLISFLNAFSLFIIAIAYSKSTYAKGKQLSWIAIPISLIPLALFKPGSTLTAICLSLISGCFALLLVSRSWWTKIIFVFAVVLAILGNLHSNELINWPAGFNQEHFLWNNTTEMQIEIQQKEALYLPYRLRPLVFGNPVYIYNALGNIFHFVSLKNLFDTLLPVYIYVVALGLVAVLKKPKEKSDWLAMSLFLISLLVVGINKSQDKFNGLYLSLPVFVYLACLGLVRVNRRLYLGLLIISLIFLTTP